MFSRNAQGERRVSPAMYKCLLSAHMIASVGWLGIAVAKLVLEVVAISTETAAVAAALHVAIMTVNLAFPPAAISTIITGLLLSLGTKWGLLTYSWVVAKIGLTAAVIITATQLGSRLILQADPPPSAPLLQAGRLWELAGQPALLLLGLTFAHILMLGTATVLSVYKPWGKTWLGQRKGKAPSLESATRSLRRVMPKHGA